MSDQSSLKQYEIGMIGLGVMGRNLLLNMADHGFSVAGYDADKGKVESLRHEAEGRDICAVEKLEEFVQSLSSPRSIILLVPAGAPVDAVIGDLSPLLQKNDLIIDAGNSHFKDTDRRYHELADQGLHFLGVGVSGGEEGARRGPAIMPGGVQKAYERIRPIFEAVAAKVGADPCVAYLGSGSAGHYVKMVHNGIEYGMMQLIAETYDLMNRGMGLKNDKMRDVFAEWNRGDLSGFLIEITSRILDRIDDRTGKPLVDLINGVAKQKGTGMWTSQNAMELQVPIPVIDQAVAMRVLSQYEDQRNQISNTVPRPISRLKGGQDNLVAELGHALYTSILITYAQGLALLATASEKYAYHLQLETVTRIWRGGCIIRSSMLEDLRAAFHSNPSLPNLLIDPNIANKVMANQESLREVCRVAIDAGVPTPCLMASLAYLDSWRSAWLPTNLIQAQRDYFGAHTYQRIDMEGSFHTEW